MTTENSLFLDKSVLTDEFKNDRKLLLLQQQIITNDQFINLIESTDKYVLVGSAVVAKSGMMEFLKNWKEHKDELLEVSAHKRIDVELFSRIDDLVSTFPATKSMIDEIRSAACSECAKNRLKWQIIDIIKKELPEKEDISQDFKTFLERVINPYDNSVNLSDVEWAKPENLIGVGLDMIEGMNSCLDCVMKHLNRAKVLYEEFILGYPEHKKILTTELAKGEKNAEQCFLKYMDVVAQTDMASSELIGQLSDKSIQNKLFMIELAQEIRQARLKFQENSDIAPDFDAFRLKVKKFQMTINNK